MLLASLSQIEPLAMGVKKKKKKNYLKISIGVIIINAIFLADEIQDDFISFISWDPTY